MVRTVDASTPVTTADRWLRAAGGFFALVVVLHNGDHLRRGADAISLDVFALGTAGVVLEVLVVVLIFQRHRWAPLASFAAGLTLALGYVMVHFLPERAWLSDSFSSATGVCPLSWAAASLEVVAALALAAAGWMALSERGGLASAAQPEPRQLRTLDALRHPVALTFTLSQVFTVAASFAQR